MGSLFHRSRRRRKRRARRIQAVKNQWKHLGTTHKKGAHWAPSDPGGDWMSDLGFTSQLPGRRVAHETQYLAEKRTAERNQRLMEQGMEATRARTEEAGGALQQGLGLLQSYRPGGAAALASGSYNQMANMIYGQGGREADLYQAMRTEAPDLMARYRIHLRKAANRRAKRANMMKMIGTGIMAAATMGAGFAAAPAVAAAGATGPAIGPLMLGQTRAAVGMSAAGKAGLSALSGVGGAMTGATGPAIGPLGEDQTRAKVGPAADLGGKGVQAASGASMYPQDYEMGAMEGGASYPAPVSSGGLGSGGPTGGTPPYPGMPVPGEAGPDFAGSGGDTGGFGGAPGGGVGGAYIGPSAAVTGPGTGTGPAFPGGGSGITGPTGVVGPGSGMGHAGSPTLDPANPDQGANQALMADAAEDPRLSRTMFDWVESALHAQDHVISGLTTASQQAMEYQEDLEEWHANQEADEQDTAAPPMYATHGLPPGAQFEAEPFQASPTPPPSPHYLPQGPPLGPDYPFQSAIEGLGRWWRDEETHKELARKTEEATRRLERRGPGSEYYDLKEGEPPFRLRK